MGPIWHWTEETRQLLKELYPAAPKEYILEKIKHKTWAACQKEASRLGIKRIKRDESAKDPYLAVSNIKSVRRGRPKKKPKNYLGKKQLEKLLRNPDITIDEIAQKLRTTPDIVRRYIFKYNL